MLGIYLFFKNKDIEDLAKPTLILFSYQILSYKSLLKEIKLADNQRIILLCFHLKIEEKKAVLHWL